MIQLCILLVSYCSANLPFYIDKNSKEIVFYSSIESGFFGDSQSEYGFNDEILRTNSNLNYRNLSMSGNELINNIFYLKKIIAFNPKIEINLSIGYHNINESYFLTGRDLGVNFAEWFPYYNLSDLYRLFTLNPMESVQGLFSIIESIKIKTIGYSNAISRIKSLKKPNNIDNVRKNFIKFYWYKNLKNLIEENSKTKFNLILLPVNQRVFKEDKVFKEFIKSLTKYPNVNFQDYQELNLNDQDFRDFTHLSSDGAKKLSLEFIKNK